MNNTSKKIYYKSNESIEIKGCTSILKTKPDLDKLFEDETSDYVIFLAHEPDTLLSVEKYNIDLMLSGHSHKGQVVIPFVGPIIKTSGSKTYYMDQYKVGETELFVSSGVGTSGLKLRLFNKPSINLYRLNKYNHL